MNTLARLLQVFAALVLVVANVRAQDEEPPPEHATLRRQPPERVERATVTDDKGILQWAEHKGAQCLNCKGEGKTACLHCDRFEEKLEHAKCPECGDEKKATCRVCYGAGTLPDALEGSPCPACGAVGHTVCGICSGRGLMFPAGSNGKSSRCDLCKGVGALPCGACKGKRIVEHPKFKPSFAEAKSSDYAKAIEALDKVLEGLPTFESSRDSRKDMKAFAKLVASGVKALPALKAAADHFEVSKKSEAGGSNWQHWPDVVAQQTTFAKENLEYWLKYEKRIMTLAMQRALKNEETAAAAGKK